MLKHHIIHQGIQTFQIPTNPLAGKLTHHLHNWQAINQDWWVINTVQGYKIDFWTIPQQSQSPLPHQFSADQLQLVTEEITELLQKQAVEEIQPSEGIHNLKDLLQPENWLSKVDLKFTIPSVQKIPEIYIPRESLSVHLSPLQTVFSPMGIHQNLQTSYSTAETG